MRALTPFTRDAHRDTGEVVREFDLRSAAVVIGAFIGVLFLIFFLAAPFPVIVAAAVISAGNAVIRKLFDTSSNAWLEVQWWLFATVFLLAAPWTMVLNEHIRIDIVNSRLPRRWRNVIEIVGHVLFLLPTAAMILITWSANVGCSCTRKVTSRSFTTATLDGSAATASRLRGAGSISTSSPMIPPG